MAIIKPASLGSRIAAALNGQPSKQPVANAGKVGSQPSGANSIRSNEGMSNVKMRQKGTPNRSYPVEVINKAKARIGGNTSASY